MSPLSNGAHFRTLLVAAALTLTPLPTLAQEVTDAPRGPVAALNSTFASLDQVPLGNPPLAWAIAPIVARNLELQAFRLGVALELMVNPAAINQLVTLSLTGGRTATELRRYFTVKALAGIVLGSGPLLGALHPRLQAGFVADRATYTTGQADPRTDLGFAIAGGLLYGITRSLVAGGDLSLERVAGLNQIAVSLSLLMGPLGGMAR